MNMAIIATNSGGNGDYKMVPPGNHRGICSMVVDLGNQRVQSQMYGEKIKHQVYVAWELPDEPVTWTDKDGAERTGPMRIGKTYTVSLHENANLRADLESWRGRAFTEVELEGFDIAKLAGVSALINVAHKQGGNGKTYANVVAVTPLPKGMEKPTTNDGALVYDADNVTAFDHLPEWLQKKIQEQVAQRHDDLPEQRGLKSSDPGYIAGFDSDLDDDVPF
jgi:hypothetical protein